MAELNTANNLSTTPAKPIFAQSDIDQLAKLFGLLIEIDQQQKKGHKSDTKAN